MFARISQHFSRIFDHTYIDIIYKLVLVSSFDWRCLRIVSAGKVVGNFNPYNVLRYPKTSLQIAPILYVSMTSESFEYVRQYCNYIQLSETLPL